MRHRNLIAFLPCLVLAGCLATSGELDEAMAKISGEVAAVADSARESSAAAREAYARGELTYAELQARLRDIRAATLEAGEAVTKETIDALKETIESRPEVVAQAGADVLGQVIPGVPGELLALIGTGLATYFAASRKAKKDAEDAVWDARYERKEEQLAKLEGGKK